MPAQWSGKLGGHQAAKRGDSRVCSKYRGIMLLTVLVKILNRVLLERMEAVDPKLQDLQVGFRRNTCRYFADQIASLRIIVKQSLEWSSHLYVNFKD
jgi:hypothetical protein